MMHRLEKTSTTAARCLAVRHQVSGLNSRFHGEQLAFADYVAQSREMITRVHAGTDAVELEKIVAGNVPFHLEPETGTSPRRGILLTHGLTDSPYFMRHLAAFFQQQGFCVMAILLPGHGTQPGDLLDVTWQEWAKAVSYGADRLAEKVDEVYLGGLSAGGALSLHHSLQDARVRGLLLFSPALRITPRAARAHWHKPYSWLAPAAKWVSIMPDADIYKYESFTKNTAAQMYALTQAVNKQLRRHEVNIPVFAAASRDDATVDVSATLEFMARAPSPSNRLVLYTTDTGNPPPNIPAEKLELVNSIVPEQKILSSAHTGIVLPPDDAHYGAAGDYSNCLHYLPGDLERYAVCNRNSPEVLQGEVTEKNLRVGVMRRLMYNPHFAALKVSLERFVEGLP